MADIAFTNIQQAPPGPYSYTVADLLLDQAGNNVAGPTDFSTFVLTEDTGIVLFNSTGGSINFLPETVADAKTGRTRVTSIAIAAGKVALFGPLKRDGWANSVTGIMRMQASATGLRACIVKML